MGKAKPISNSVAAKLVAAMHPDPKVEGSTLGK
jgi:hypothetical protein